MRINKAHIYTWKPQRSMRPQEAEWPRTLLRQSVDMPRRNRAAHESDNRRITLEREGGKKFINHRISAQLTTMDHKTNRFPRFQEGTCGTLSGTRSRSGRYHLMCLLCGRKREQKEKDSSLSIALATPVSFIMVHIATVWAGNHGNCPSQTRQ